MNKIQFLLGSLPALMLVLSACNKIENQACYKPPSTIQSFVSTTTPIQFNLDTCQDIPRDKSQQPPPCTIDPATGACN